MVCLNPDAKVPLPKDFFEDAALYYELDGRVTAKIPEIFFPYASTTKVYCKDYFDIPSHICRITRREFSDMIDIDELRSSDLIELAWLKTKDNRYIATEILNIKTNKYSYAIYSKYDDEYESFSYRKGFDSEEETINRCSMSYVYCSK